MTRSDTDRRSPRARCAWLALAALAPAIASATEGEQVVSGAATFTRDGGVLQIDTATPQTVIQWHGGFDIAPGATVVINQPSSLANTLNYDLSTDVSRIEGSLFSNGGVWIINPVGVFFGDQAVVDVGRLVAGAGVVDASDFAAGIERVRDLTGPVEVAAGAQIHAAESVLLVGAAVANYGNISAADGMIALVAGDAVRLAHTDGRVIVTADPAIAPDPARWGVVQAGTVDAGPGGRVALTAGDAYSLAINHTGITRAREIEIAGGAGGGVAVSGTVDASDRSAGATGGRIAVTGERIALLGAQLDASGDAGGGEIRVGGDLRGEGELPTAKRTVVDGASSLRADAITTGDGGTIIVWSDEATRFYGSLSARGGASAGDGGFAEISGASLDARGRVDLGADAGRTGTLLYDPKDIVLHAGTQDGTDAPDATDGTLSEAALGQVWYGSQGEALTPFDVYESELENTTANILLQATNSISSPDTFDVDLGTRSLAMQTRNDAGDEQGTTFAPGIHLTDVSFATQGGTISLATGNGSIEVGDLTTRGADATAGGTGGTGGSVTLSAAGTNGAITTGMIDTSGGNGNDGRGGDAGAIVLGATGDVVTTGAIVARGGNASGAGTTGGRGGFGGTVTIASETGNVELNGGADLGGGAGRVDAATVVNGVPQFNGPGGSAGRLDVAVSGNGASITVGDVVASGGSGTNGAGGAGGVVTLTAVDGGITIGDVTLNGGSGTGAVAEGEDGSTAAQGVKGGTGGNLTVAANAGTAEGAVGGGDVSLGGEILSLGGLGEENPDEVPDPIEDDAENNGVGGAVRITSALDVVGSADTRIQAGTTAIDGRNVFATGTPILTLAGAGTGPAGTVDRATVTTGRDDTVAASTGNVRARLDDDAPLDRFEVIETDARGHVDVRSEGGTLIAEGDGADGTGTVHTITRLDTNGRGEHFTYRLADPLVSAGATEQPVEQIDVTELHVASGAVNLGAQGGVIANARTNAADPEADVLLGRIQGAGAGPHATTAGTLQLLGTNIGDVTPLVVTGVGAAAIVEVTVAGDIGSSEVPGLVVPGLVVGGVVDMVDVTQRDAEGSIAIELPNGGAGPEVSIEGTVVDDGAHRTEATRVVNVDTTASGTDFFFELTDDSATSGGTVSGEPLLTIGSGAVRLGTGSVAGFSTAGDLALESAVNAPAIDANGGTVFLLAGENSDGNGGIAGSGSGQPDIADARNVVLVAEEGVGTEAAPIRTSAAEATVSLAGLAGNGDFRVVNESGAISLDKISVTSEDQGEPETVSVRGIVAGGNVDLENGGRQIVLGAIAQPEDSQLQPHVQSVGGQRYGGDVAIFNPLVVEEPDDGILIVDAARLVAGGEVLFEGDVDPLADPFPEVFTSLEVSAAGATTFMGDVGRAVGGVASLDALTLTDARFSEGAHTVTVASGDFRAIDGPGSVALRGLPATPDDESVLVFRADVGTNAPLATFDADAERLVFDTRTENGAVQTSADRIIAQQVRLNAELPVSTETDVATIADTAGGLSIESAGDVEMGRGEKLSTTAVLAIRAGGTARLGDLSASQLSVDAAQIVVHGRDPGQVALPSGALVTDRGVDWVANDITTNVAPVWDGNAAPPTFVLGSGGIRTGGAVPFDVVRFTPDGDEIRAANFAGSDGRTLDLTGIGPRAVSDASRDVPHEAPPVLPGLAARPGDESPSPPREVSGEELIGALHCRSASGESCAPPAVGDDPLATERAIEIGARYRALLADDAARASLRGAFAPLASVPPGDDAALSRSLAHDPALGDARARIADLAVALTQVELLGLAGPESERARHAIAADFAAATGVAGLDADAVLAAVDASGVAAMP